MPEFYNGAIDFKPGEEDDQRPKIDAACAPGCTSAWKNYLKCGDRIEAKVKPYCSLRPHPTRHAAQPRGPPSCARSLASERCPLAPCFVTGTTTTTTPSRIASRGSCCITGCVVASALAGLLLVRRAREIVAHGTWTTTSASTSAL